MTATATTTQTFAQQFTDALAAKFATEAHVAGWDVRTGRKYDKVVHTLGSQTFVHAFVEKETGLVFKPAGFNAPAKGARYNLSTAEGFAATVEAANWSGGYLYR